MRKAISITLFFAALSGGGAATASQGSGAITGTWATGSQGGRVEIYRCGPSLCGKIVDAAPLRANPDQRDVNNPDRKLRERRLKGLIVLKGFGGGPREWKGGPVYDPETGDGAAKGYLTLRADGKLEVKGCKAVLFCRTKVWTHLP
ncbi:DUF2147 domain-containing protein [Sphingopyxis panaciterrulae]|uniref:Uncharacterized protein (DUF2147 family) n=1 Tax=Sphingopyxis panaciterrulae TaxID=462372 RepID=A0A7W9B8W4_9SPHN|nr:DUF2147 domain-containing protein [Sphingopyxis panaciterrulae]MBB5708414.1 uncharacterized protein (DUF2147 family) [Sphingopyxis panaciterrulae]